METSIVHDNYRHDAMFDDRRVPGRQELVSVRRIHVSQESGMESRSLGTTTCHGHETLVDDKVTGYRRHPCPSLDGSPWQKVLGSSGLVNASRGCTASQISF